ncbi:hypothetical protein [Rhodococcus sp. USK13]|uniref:hypothetical protein n=1 Tax=Rhodococcus sp. USK13 TaxID=2806442 RepID=UPI001BD0AAB7|nr:hypothetical protein [Rhodococcus sp. USK13]
MEPERGSSKHGPVEDEELEKKSRESSAATDPPALRSSTIQNRQRTTIHRFAAGSSTHRSKSSAERYTP